MLGYIEWLVDQDLREPSARLVRGVILSLRTSIVSAPMPPLNNAARREAVFCELRSRLGPKVGA